MYKMLIVEDERWEREGLVDFLDWKSYGIEICGTACDGKEGLEMAINLKPHIIITDIKMTIMGGLEMSKEIRAIMPEVNIIILTGYDNFKYAKEAINFRAFSYLLKPIDEEECIEVIKRVVDKCDREVTEAREITKLKALKLDNSQIVGNMFKVDLDEIRSNKDKYLIDKVVQLIEEKYMMNISLKTISNDVFMSPNYLGFIFKKSLGKHFNDYLLEYRMEKAKFFLRSTKNKIAKVAQDVGIPNASYFCAVFKKKYGISPGEYQELLAREKHS